MMKLLFILTLFITTAISYESAQASSNEIDSSKVSIDKPHNKKI